MQVNKETAVAMNKEYNLWAGASNTMGTAVYKTVDKFTYSKAIDYKSLLWKTCVGDNKKQPIAAYVFTGCNISKNILEDIQNRYVYDFIPLHYKTDNGKYNLLEKKKDIYYVTLEQLKKFGWKNCSESEVAELNRVLKKYEITTPANIALFMATAGHESGLGSILLEKGPDNYFADKDYSKNDRGAGYIQITHRNKQLEFLKSVNDKFEGANTAEYIAKNYPWEASGWFWRNGCSIDFKEYIDNYFTEKNGLGVFLITQYFINGYLSEKSADNDLASIRNGNSFKIENERLYVNGRDYRLPNGWSNTDTGRYVLYEKAIKIFK